MWRDAVSVPPAELLRSMRASAEEHDLFGTAAQLAYYLLLALFPFLFFFTVILGYVLEGSEGIRDSLYVTLERLGPGTQAASLVRATLEEIRAARGGGKLSLSLAGAVWAASLGFSALIRSLNTIYRATEARPWWRRRLLAGGLTVLATALGVLGLGLLVFGGQAGAWLAGRLGIAAAMAATWDAVRWIAGLVAAALAFDLLYNFGPHQSRVRTAWLSPGAVVALALWLAVSFGFRAYLVSFAGYSATYGSLGTVIILMVWLYLSAASVLIGAEINAAIDSAADRDVTTD